MLLREAKEKLREAGYRLVKNSNKYESFKSFKKRYLSEELEEDEETKKSDDEGEVSDKIKNEFAEIVSDLKNKELSDCVSAINNLKPRQAKILSLGFGEGKLAKKPSCNSKNIRARDLRPTQKEIDITGSLRFPLTNIDSAKASFKNGVKIKGNPIVTYGGKYVIDGHHRWSQVYLLDPNTELGALDFAPYGKNKSTEDILKDFQGAIAATVINDDGKVELPSAKVKEGWNLFDYIKSKEGISKFKNYIISTMEKANTTDGLVKLFAEHYPKDNIKSGEDVANKIIANAKIMAEESMPEKSAPPRAEMPQTDVKGKEGKTGMDISRIGITDI